MPVYLLTDEPVFPSPSLADDEGLLAVGGDLTVERLLMAYSLGIFPWFSEGQPILWWSPNPRAVLFPSEFKRSKSLRRTVESQTFRVSFDQDFTRVINACSTVPRNEQQGTWITDEMKTAYIKLHENGYAHSVEVWNADELVGGLYGISLGTTFFGESMFHKQTDASKVALWYLVDKLLSWEFDLIDVQQDTAHLKSLGAKTIPRENFLNLLATSMKKPSRKGKWCGEI